MSVHDVESRRAEHEGQATKAAEHVQKLAQAYRACFTSDAGRQVLDDLRACYGGSTTGNSPRKTDIHSAQRDVLLRVEDLVRLAEVEPGQAVTEMSKRQTESENLINPWSRYERER